MLHRHYQLFSAAVYLADLCIIGLATWIASLWTALGALSFVNPNAPISEFVGQVVLLLVAWLFFSQRLGFYGSRRAERFLLEVEALIVTCLSSFGIASLISGSIYGGLAFDPLMSLLLASSGILALRLILRATLRSFRRQGRNYRRVIVLGHGASSQRIIDELVENEQFGLRLCGTLAFAAEKDKIAFPRRFDYLGDVTRLRKVIAENSIDSVIICPPPQASMSEVQQSFATCDEAGIPCHYAPEYFALRNLQPSITWYGSVPTLTFTGGPNAPISLAIKRAMDIVGATIGIVVFSPVFLACALAVKLQDGGRIFHRQQRSGLNGSTFTFLKFRSMCSDAEARQSALAGANEVDGPVFKIRQDPRITAVGSFLRKYSLDELPQLFHVLSGSMSLVGPRPPIPAEVDKYDWWQRRRLSVKPGITCIWQVWGRNRVNFRRWMEMDLQYIDNWSLWMDIKLLMRTVGVVMGGTGV